MLRGTALKIFAENVYENENSKKLIISDKEDIEKVGDVGKEVGREALGNVYDDKIDVIVNVLYLENLKLVIELESTSSCSLFYRNQIQPASHRAHFLMVFLVEDEEK